MTSELFLTVLASACKNSLIEDFSSFFPDRTLSIFFVSLVQVASHQLISPAVRPVNWDLSFEKVTPERRSLIRLIT